MSRVDTNGSARRVSRRTARRHNNAVNAHQGGRVPTAPPPTDGAPAPPVPASTPGPTAEAPAAPPARKRRRLLLLAPILLVVGLVALAIGVRFWYESVYFVITDNAQVTGDLVQVGPLNAGRVVETRVDVGQTVEQDQVIATVAVPQQVGTVPFSDTPLLEHTGSLNTLVPVRSPLSGIVAARTANVGGTVQAGQPIYMLVNPRQVWVNANIDEDKVDRVQPGQPVEVYITALGRSFPGQVEAVTPASAATFSLLPPQNLSGNFNKVTQWVPVKIRVFSDGTVLPLGTSASVRIRVREDKPLPWLP
jgi:multidrug resistance efflux pump